MIITTYEHSTLRYGSGCLLTEQQWKRLIAFRSKTGNERYFDVVHRGVKFRSYVGVLRIGKLTIEVLPKLDGGFGDTYWRNRLLDMVGVVEGLNAHHPTTAQLRTRPNNLLDYYLFLFATELEQLLRGGLIRAYRERKGNRNALRGRLEMARHLTQNIVHRERFYVRDTTYDHQHVLNQILRMALDLAKYLARPLVLRQRFAELDLTLPTLAKIRVDDGVFHRLYYDRRTSRYRPAIAIAKLLLLNFHPDLKSGSNDVLALLFNMNHLWEGFLLASLKRFGPDDLQFIGQQSAIFWQGERSVSLRPDILVRRGDRTITVLDAKWKNTHTPGSKDLYQLYAYARHFEVGRVALLYPFSGLEIDTVSRQSSGALFNTEQGVFADGIRCDVVRLPVCDLPLTQWMKRIADHVLGELDSTNE